MPKTSRRRMRYRAPHLTEEALASRTSAEPGPHEQLDASRRQRALNDCISQLPEIYQSALRLHYWIGTSVVDIAELLLVPENTVKSYMHRARLLLSVMLRERGFEDV